jgi:hypothetical protein
MRDARKALLDALSALEDHLDALVLVGAQAIYFHTTDLRTVVADATRDADIAINQMKLTGTPTLEFALRKSGFKLGEQPGSWISDAGTIVDIMMPKAFNPGSNRAGGIAPHNRLSARSTIGIEGCLIDNQLMKVESLDSKDLRTFEILVAGPGGLLIAKLHKVGEHIALARSIENKDAFDIFKLLVALPVEQIAERVKRISQDEFSRYSTEVGLKYLANLFAAGSDASGSQLAAEAVRGIDDMDFIAQSVSNLAKELLRELE